MISYLSTRGQSPALGFEDVVLAGLAPDGGLYVPDALPTVTPQQLAAWKKLSYPELAANVILPFTGDSFTHDELLTLLKDSYASFDHPQTAPLVKLGDREHILELFHGPTLAFKDFALQFLGRLLDRILQKRGTHVTVVGATSGDTGSAAIAGCRGRANMDIFILHPKGRTSDIQRRQMTTVPDKNEHNIALTGTFDDCQNLVKALFADSEFRTRKQLVAVNSINWARILAQVIYYFYAALTFDKPVSFCVPTGNFGDIYAGTIAARMGLPVEKFIIASNRNDILTRCHKTGEYKTGKVEPSLSPSMDIQISSNFERLLYDFSDSATIRTLTGDLKQKGAFTLPPAVLEKLRTQFLAEAVNDDDTRKTIAAVYKSSKMLIDPHTAVGVCAARRCKTNGDMVILSTAHPAKFPEAVLQATGQMPKLPAALTPILTAKERYDTLPVDVQAIKNHIDKATI